MEPVEYNTPMWSLESRIVNGVKYKPVIIELPITEDNILLRIDDMNLFEYVVVSQIVDIILSLNGAKRDKVNVFDEEVLGEKYNMFSDDDILLICFIKNYRYTTKTIVVPITDKGIEYHKNLDNTIVNGYIRDARFHKFFNMKLHIDVPKVRFLLYSSNDGDDLLDRLHEHRLKIK